MQYLNSQPRTDPTYSDFSPVRMTEIESETFRESVGWFLFVNRRREREKKRREEKRKGKE